VFVLFPFHREGLIWALVAGIVAALAALKRIISAKVRILSTILKIRTKLSNLKGPRSQKDKRKNQSAQSAQNA